MTRLAREAWKHYDRIMNFVYADEELGCGFAPAGYYDEACEEATRLLEVNAKVRGYDSYQDFCFASMEKEPDEVKYGWV